MKRRIFVWVLALVCLVSSSSIQAGYTNLFIFGDSLSDSGNNAIAFDALGAPLPPGTLRTPVPISGNSFVPTFPYASGHYTNDQVWAQSFASALGLTANPSLSGGTDYAFGGASTGPLSPNPFPGGLLNPFPPSLETQVAFFLLQHSNEAPSDALYVVAGGGNNARDALPSVAAAIISTCTDPFTFQVCANGIIQPTADAFAGDVKHIVSELETDGAKNIVVWDTPDVGKAPAVIAMGGSAIGSLLAFDMNAALMTAIGGDSDVRLFDIFALVDEVVSNNGAFGIDLSNVTDACAQLSTCNPSQYFFWDGIHPTSAGQEILTEAMLRTVPEPATLALLGIALAGLGSTRRRKLN